MKFAVLIIILACVAVNIFSAGDYESNLREGIRLFKADLLREAERAFRDLQKDHPDSLVVLSYLGRINVMQQEWADARQWFNDIIERDSEQVEAHYYLGICYRETGKYKAFVLQSRDWRRAERHFARVIELAGPYKDVYYHYALLKRYWKDYTQAVDLAEQQLLHAPDEKSHVGVHRFYESFLFNAPKEFHAWATGRGGDRNALYLGESHRQRKEFVEAESFFHRLSATTTSDILVPLHIALAKVKYQLGQQDSCQYYYENALQSILSNVDAELMFQDVKFILSDAEWLQYRDLRRAEDKKEFFIKIWLSRNPMPASQMNYRMIEHVRRVIAAEQDYYFDGVRSQVNNPDKLNYLSFPRVFELNEKYNDKGLVYIRHGEPDDRAFHVEAGAPLNETWVFYPRGQLNKKLIFHFWQDDTQAGNNWRFIPSIPQYMAESRLNMDPIFSRLYTANELEALSIDNEMKLQSQELVKIGMDTDQHSWSKQLRSIIFPFYMATFREGPDVSRCELYFSLNTGDVLPANAPHTLQDSVSLNFAVFDMSLDPLVQLHQNVQIGQITEMSEKMDFWPSQFAFTGPPGEYQIALDIRTPNDEAIGGYKFRLNVSDYAEEKLKMSGLVLAKSISPAQQQDLFYKNGLTVIPNPGKLFERKNPLHIYFELYNLDAGMNKKEDFVVRYNVRLLEERAKGVISKIGRIFRNPQPSISNQVERESSTPTSIEYIALDLGKNVPGIYELGVTAFVPGKDDSAARKINFELQ